MSWDIYVSGDDRSWETGDSGVAADAIGPLGSVPQVRQRVEAVWPETTWDADGTAWVERADVTAELELGTDDPVGSLMVRVRGGRDPVRAVLELLPPAPLDPDGHLDRAGADGAGERLRPVACDAGGRRAGARGEPPGAVAGATALGLAPLSRSAGRLLTGGDGRARPPRAP